MFGRKKKKKLFQEMRKTAEFDSMRDMDDDEVDQFTVTDGDGSSEMGEYQGDKHDCFDEYQVAGEENCRESYDEKTQMSISRCRKIESMKTLKKSGMGEVQKTVREKG